MCLSGLRAVPPHQRTTIYTMAYGAQTNVVECSRGTSKTASVCNLFASWKGLTTPKRKMVTLSATGFRGGQVIFNDTEKWMQGGWASQDDNARYFERSMDGEHIVKRAQNYWEQTFLNFSTNLTIPTNDKDRARGIRGHLLFVDEANTIDWEFVTEVADSFLNVKDDFEFGGAEALDNQIFFTSTIDFNWRPFQDVIRAARAGLARDMEALAAAKRGDDETYMALKRLGLHKYQYVRFDYTDLLIRDVITTRDGRRMRIKWPNPKIPLTEDIMGIPFSERGPQGVMEQQGQPCKYYSTYPIDKSKLETPLYDGTADTGSWLAEQRNITDTSTGDVYPHDLVDRASCEGAHCITKYDDTNSAYRTANAVSKQDYVAPVLFECTDPCVIGVDFASSNDFSALVVIRLGPLATGDYDYIRHHGKTSWCNVIWAEQHKYTSHKDVADKIRQYMKRYNLVYFPPEHDMMNDWEICRAIGLDMKGGGTGVRDKLAYIDERDDEIPQGEFRIYDPTDRDPRILGFATNPASRPMLDAIQPSAPLNDTLVTFTVAQMEQKLLYIGKYVDKTRRAGSERRMDPGFEGVNGLNYQLRRIKSEHQINYRKFFVEGDTSKTTNKKDYWSAFIYAAKQARAHLIRHRSIDEAPPAMAALSVTANGGHPGGSLYGKGRSAGARDNYDRNRQRRRL